MSLICKIENTEMMKNITQVYFLGQAGYILKTSETIIYIDPYLSNYIENPLGIGDTKMKRLYPSPINPKEIHKVDAVLCTHAHYDHMDPWTLESISCKFKLYCTEIAYKENPINLNRENITYVIPDNYFYIKNAKIAAIPAAHYNLFDEKSGNIISASYIIEIKSKTMLFWGDGILYEGLIENLSKYRFNYAFIPINGRDWFREKEGIIGNINFREVVELSKRINVETLIPNHYDLFYHNSENVEYFNDSMKKENPSQNVKILNVGEHIDC